MISECILTVTDEHGAVMIHYCIYRLLSAKTTKKMEYIIIVQDGFRELRHDSYDWRGSASSLTFLLLPCYCMDLNPLVDYGDFRSVYSRLRSWSVGVFQNAKCPLRRYELFGVDILDIVVL